MYRKIMISVIAVFHSDTRNNNLGAFRFCIRNNLPNFQHETIAIQCERPQ